MKQCANCHTMVDDKNKFCPECGGNAFDPPSQQDGNNADTRRSSGSKKLIGIVVAVVVLAAIVITLILMLNRPVDRFIESLDNLDPSAAVEIYRDKIIGNPKKMDEAHNEALELAEDIFQKFEDETLSYDEASAKLYAIEECGIIYESIYEYIDNMEAIHEARETFLSAESAMNSKEYSHAIDLYRRVIKLNLDHVDDATQGLAKAINLFRSDVLGEVQTLTAKNDYNSALTVLDNSLDVLEDDAELLRVREQCVSDQHEMQIQQMIQECRAHFDSGNYIDGIQLITTCIEENPDEAELQKAKSGFLEEYEAYVVTESKKLASAGDFQRACELTVTGLGYFSSPDVTALQIAYKSHIPVQIGDMEIYKNKSQGGDWGSETDERDKYLTDNRGNQYSHSFFAGCGYVQFLVNQKYATLSGVVAFPKGLSTDGYKSSATLSIFAGSEVIETFENVTEDFEPTKFSIDISGYETIALRWECDGMNIWHDWGEFATVFDGVFTPIPMDIPA